MSYRKRCLICACSIDSSLTNTELQWQANFQVLKLKKVKNERTGERLAPEKGRLVRGSVNPSKIPGNGHYVHYRCWSIVTEVVETTEFEQAWLDKFYNCIEAFGPLTSLRTDEFPDCNDERVFHPPSTWVCHEWYLEEEELDEGRHGRPSTEIPPPVFDRFNLPDEIVQRIYYFLPTFFDVVNLEFAAAQAANLGVWLSLGRKFIAAHPRLVELGPQRLSIYIRTALKNTSAFPEDYPRAANYESIWDGIEDILNELSAPPLGENVDLGVASSSAPGCSLPSFTYTKELTIPHTFSKVNLGFKKTNDEIYFSGLSFDNHHFGYPGDYTNTSSTSSLYGLHLAMLDGFAISVRIKIDSGWTSWAPRLSRSWTKAQYLQIEPFEEIDKIQASFDTFRMVNIRYTTRSQSTMLIPFACQNNIPDTSRLPAIALVDRLQDDSECMNWTFMYDFGRVTAVSAFVRPESREIVAFEFIMDNRPILVGQYTMEWDRGSTKLSFHLGTDEVITGLGCAKAILNEGVSIKFLTNLGRSVLFGDETPELWNFATIEYGFYCAAPNVDILTAGYPTISRAGVFKTRDFPINGDAYVQPTEWPVIDASCTHRIASAFVSFASLKSVKWIIVYHLPGFGWLTGIQLIYESGHPIMLGAMEEECISLAIREPITSIRVNFDRASCSFLYQVTGISFITETRVTGAGDWEADAERLEMKVDVLDVPKNEIDPPLYWAFSHGASSCLSFSPDDDFESDHPRSLLELDVAY